ncbi:hypothetical protein EYC84_008469 [Monilinia fructicola]|uniref:Uncharacterized protein n=1 Tax=Monilinia fructicola TaxID=38448 RepID=A0A5M9JHB5_MONFR|nr:hypothetical protein EYC84_008469 [Monilinia fructicola]
MGKLMTLNFSDGVGWILSTGIGGLEIYRIMSAMTGMGIDTSLGMYHVQVSLNTSIRSLNNSNTRTKVPI